MLIVLFKNVVFLVLQRKRTIINALWEKFNISLILFVSANGLKCFTDIEGRQITKCKENEGFRTCFTKYNDSKYFENLFWSFINYNLVHHENVKSKFAYYKWRAHYTEDCKECFHLAFVGKENKNY